jgi:hypothetical protein
MGLHPAFVMGTTTSSIRYASALEKCNQIDKQVSSKSPSLHLPSVPGEAMPLVCRPGRMTILCKRMRQVGEQGTRTLCCSITCIASELRPIGA